MASYADQLRERLAAISESSEAATTWEQLKKARERQRQASLMAIQSLKGETDAYNQRLANFAQMYGSAKITPPTIPTTSKKKPAKKSKRRTPNNGSLGDAFSGIGSVFDNLF
jgi:hypothetical protein